MKDVVILIKMSICVSFVFVAQATEASDPNNSGSDMSRPLTSSSAISRRELLGLVALATSGVLAGESRTHAAEQAKSAAQTQPSDHIVYHYDVSKPYDYLGINQGFPPPKDKRVTVNNFMLYPYIHWFQQHPTEMWGHQVVSRGSGPVTVLPVHPNRELEKQIRVTMKSGEKLDLPNYLKRTHTNGFLLLHKGMIVAEHYDHGLRPDKRHIIASITKSFTGGVIANLIDRADLNPNTAVSHYVEELKGSGFEGVTIQQLLDMQSGVDFTGPTPEEVQDFELTDPRVTTTSKSALFRYMRAQGYFTKLPGEPVDTSVAEVLMSLSRSTLRKPGEFASYSNGDVAALAWAAECQTKKAFAHLASEHVWSKLGAEQDLLIQSNSNGEADTPGGAAATLRDMGRWTLAQLNRGRFGKSQVFPEHFLNDIRFQCDPNKISADPEKASLNRSLLISGWAYKNLQWVFWGPGKDAAACGLGLGGQYTFWDPTYDTAIVKFSSYPSIKDLMERHAEELYVFREIGQKLSSAGR